MLSYDRPELLDKALHSIAAQTYPRFEVLVVDNQSASSDRISEIVSTFKGVRLIANDHNLGFTGGMNQGLASATGDYIYLTEDDVELAGDCLALLIDHLEQHPEVGLAGPVMWNRHSPTIRCAGGHFTLGGVYRMTVTSEGERALADTGPFRTEFLPGAMVAAKTALLRDLGGFREDFFMYREDVELCARVMKRGLGIAIVPAARVYHHEPPDAPASATLAFHKHKNLAAVYFLHAPLAVLPQYLLRYAVFDGVRHAFRDRPARQAWLKAWAWVAMRSPKLLGERLRRS